MVDVDILFYLGDRPPPGFALLPLSQARRGRGDSGGIITMVLSDLEV